MRKRSNFIFAALFALWLAAPFGLQAQTVIQDFTLKNTDGTMVSLSSFKGKKAVAVIFTGNHCVYSKKYEDRILKLAADYTARDVQFILINSNSPELSEDDTFEAMQIRAQEKEYTIPYLHDPDQMVAHMFKAQKNPDIYVLTPAEGGFKVAYTGLIDDNPLMEDAVTLRYAASALDKVLAGAAPEPPTTQVQGCGIKGMEE